MFRGASPHVRQIYAGRGGSARRRRPGAGASSLRRLRKRADQGRTEDGEQEPKFHGPVYTVDYKDVDDEDEKGK